MGDKETSKFISLILRHKPEAIGIQLDEHGWANVDELIEGIGKTRSFDIQDLERIVAEDAVDVELEEKEPPAVLWHGTGEKFTASIDKEGLIPKSRLYVHLSADPETAKKVGQRHGKPVVYTIDAGKMFEDGYKFYLSVNGVWLTKRVPAEYMG